MTLGLLGCKRGMTRVFTDDGASLPVTVVEVKSNYITQVKTTSTDGYNAVQLTTGERKPTRVNKPEAGHFAKANVKAGVMLHEFHIPELATGDDEDEKGALSLGSEITIDIFKSGQYVDVVGTSKGKGFAGVVKRYNFSTQDATHGNSLAHRAPGSIGQNQSPGKVFKGKKMAGQMGNKRCTIQSLQIVRVDRERGLLLIKGAIPGATGGMVVVQPAVKRPEKEDKQS